MPRWILAGGLGALAGSLAAAGHLLAGGTFGGAQWAVEVFLAAAVFAAASELGAGRRTFVSLIVATQVAAHLWLGPVAGHAFAPVHLHGTPAGAPPALSLGMWGHVAGTAGAMLLAHIAAVIAAVLVGLVGAPLCSALLRLLLVPTAVVLSPDMALPGPRGTRLWSFPSAVLAGVIVRRGPPALT